MKKTKKTDFFNHEWTRIDTNMGRSWCRQREVELDGEGGAWAGGSFAEDVGVEGLDEVFDDGEAEAGAAEGAVAGGVDAVETHEDAGEVLGGDADAGVAHGDDGGVAGAAEVEFDAAAGGRVGDGIVDEVVDDKAQGFAVAGHDEIGGFGGGDEGDVFLGGDGLESFVGEGDDGVEIDRHALEEVGGGFEASEDEEIVDELVQAIALGGDAGEETLAIGSGHAGVVEEGADDGGDGGERGLEFVGNVGGEGAADLLEATQFGEIVEDKEHAEGGVAGIGERGSGDGEDAIVGVGLEADLAGDAVGLVAGALVEIEDSREGEPTVDRGVGRGGEV